MVDYNANIHFFCKITPFGYNSPDVFFIIAVKYPYGYN